MTVIHEGSAQWPGVLESLGAVAVGRTIMWDFDGVIANTEPIHERSYRIVLEPRHVTLPTNYFDELIGKTETQIWALLQKRGVPVTHDEIAGLMRERQDVILRLALAELSPNWFVRNLAELFGRVGAHQFIVSNGERRVIRPLLAEWKLDGLIRFPEASHARLSKDQLIKTFSVEGPTVIIEDNLAYLTHGREAGAYPIAVRHGLNTDADFGDVLELVA